MLGFIGKKIGSTHIYKNFIFTHITVVSIFNCYLFKIFVNSNKYFFNLSYFFNFSFSRRIFLLKNFNVNYFDFLFFKPKNVIPLNIFYINQKVNIYGTTIGKGFSGVIKRHNFSLNNKSHGNSKSYRKPGSIGMCQDPGRVYPGKKMAGRLGGKKSYLKNISILNIDFFYNLFYLKGPVPGFNNSNILISPF